jgi:hypothetical protein
MERLKKIENVVERILDLREDTRENDDILYLCVCEYFHRGISSMTVKDFFKKRSGTSCPNFASVVRARRKIFERRPELKPEKITKIREDMEDVYIDYAING